jgi:hypothetical protein
MKVDIAAVITAVIPFATALFKRAFRTDRIEDKAIRRGVNGLLPVVLGVVCATATCYLGDKLPGLDIESGAHDLATCITAGLVVGTTASWVRDQADRWASLGKRLLQRRNP